MRNSLGLGVKSRVASYDVEVSREVCAAAVCLVLGFTPMIGRAAPGPPESTERPGKVEIISSAIAIVIQAVPLDREQHPAIDLGAPPIAVELPAGRYRLEAAGPGYHPWSQELEIRSGEVVELQVEPELIDVARLELRAVGEASEGAEVSLDGVRLCTLPCSTEIQPGSHRIDIHKRRHKGLQFGIDVAQADELEIDVELQPATSRAPAIITGSVALTSLTVAIGFSIRAARTRRALASDLDNLVQYDADDRRIDNGKRDAVIATSLSGATAAVGLLTLYYLLRQPGASSRADLRRRSLARWQLVPTFGPHGGGMVGVVEF
jgi:hypothetical protein